MKREGREDAADLADTLGRGWRSAPLGPRQVAMCGFAEKLALDAAGTSREDIEALRSAGLDDRSILDVVQIIAYFCYVNRIASALGVPLEPRRGGPPE